MQRRPLASAIEIARKVVADEAAALAQLAPRIDDRHAPALQMLLDARQVVVSGLGKSGDIARKIAASLTSTGTPAVFVHPVEGLHGDLGLVTDGHCLIALSRSGNTDEMTRFVEHFRRLGGPVIAVTQNDQSRLAELAQHTIVLPDVPEAGPLQLAPTTSCVMMLAVGDALAMALLHARGFRAEDFAQYHPEGTLGRRLLLRAGNLMHAGSDLPKVPASAGFDELLVEMTAKHLGIALIVRDDGTMLGTFTDGDLRRLLERVENPRRLSAEQAWRQSRRSPDEPPVRCSTVGPQKLAVDCLRLMRESQITHLVVTDEADRPIGLLRLMDLIAAGLG